MMAAHLVSLMSDILARMILLINAILVEITKEMVLRLAMTEISQTGRGVSLIVLEK